MTHHEEQLTDHQLRRYSRSISLQEIGEAGQLRLLHAGVLVVGCGALGSACAMYLAGSGVGNITVVDFDTLDISNLQRQLSFTEAQLGEKKSAALSRRLREINGDIEVAGLDLLLTRENIGAILDGCSLVVEASDNPATKYLVTQACESREIPYCLGGVSRFSGQVICWAPGYRGYADLFPDPEQQTAFLPCSLDGILGPLPGIIGCMQAAEAIKILTGAGQPLFNRLLLFNALDASSSILPF